MVLKKLIMRKSKSEKDKLKETKKLKEEIAESEKESEEGEEETEEPEEEVAEETKKDEPKAEEQKYLQVPIFLNQADKDEMIYETHLMASEILKALQSSK